MLVLKKLKLFRTKINSVYGEWKTLCVDGWVNVLGLEQNI